MQLSEKMSRLGTETAFEVFAKARALEKELGRDVLCPVALDEAWRTCSWPGPLRRQIEDYHILDFSGWRDTATLERQFGKLLDGLSLFYKPGAS